MAFVSIVFPLIFATNVIASIHFVNVFVIVPASILQSFSFCDTLVSFVQSILLRICMNVSVNVKHFCMVTGWCMTTR